MVWSTLLCPHFDRYQHLSKSNALILSFIIYTKNLSFQRGFIVTEELLLFVHQTHKELLGIVQNKS